MSEGDAGQEYDGPRLGEPVKFSILVGPEQGVGIIPMQAGGIYVTPESMYHYNGKEWIDLEIDAKKLFRIVATYVDPQAVREGRQQI